MNVPLELQAFRFWRCATAVRHNTNLTPQQGLDEIDYNIKNFQWDKKIVKRFTSLAEEVLKGMENEPNQQSKTGS